MITSLRSRVSRTLGRGVQTAMRLRGGGSALPGLIVERIDPTFLARALSTVPKGVVVITGTNGKTTTTKMVVQLLRAHGLTVFTNPSGSNFTRGIVASLLDHVDEHGHLKADVAVLELDEAHAVHFVRQAPPRFVLVLNVLRDQLDRFGEIDHTARLLSKVVAATTDGVVLNREDSLVRKLAPTGSKVEVRYFGLSRDLQAKFPSDAELHGGHTSTAKNPAIHPGDVTLETVKGRDATFSFGKAIQSPISLQLDGVYNVLNAAGALALARMITGASAAESKRLLHELSEVKPAFGRGETVAIDGRPCEIVLVKNPSGFRLALSSYADQPAATMIAINDNYADGRDMSWLWDVDFASLKGVDTVSGLRAYDMALRLQYDEVDVSHVEPRLVPALTRFIHQTSGRRRIYCTYTAMLTLRRELGRHYHLEAIK